MHSDKKRAPIILPIALLALTALACNAAGVSQLGPAVPTEPIEVSADALASFNSKWRDLSVATPDGPFAISFTEAELTSAVNAAIEQTEEDSGQSIPLEGVEVHVRDGAIDVYGQAKIDPLTINGVVTVVPTIGPDGWIELDVASVEFGAIEIEDEMLDELVDSVEHGINEPIQASPLDIQLESISMANNELTISGTLNP
jgi:uncharacterized protein YpmS